jgi:RNase P subunit RPR2
MMPSHQDRIKAKNPEMNCEHLFVFHAQSHIAPFFESNGDRTTISTCVACGLEKRYTRTQEQFELDLKYLYPS